MRRQRRLVQIEHRQFRLGHRTVRLQQIGQPGLALAEGRLGTVQHLFGGAELFAGLRECGGKSSEVVVRRGPCRGRFALDELKPCPGSL